MARKTVMWVVSMDTDKFEFFGAGTTLAQAMGALVKRWDEHAQRMRERYGYNVPTWDGGFDDSINEERLPQDWTPRPGETVGDYYGVHTRRFEAGQGYRDDEAFAE